MWQKCFQSYFGITDTEGQISQIEITESFLDEQLKQAIDEKCRNEKLYLKLGICAGLAISIMLI